MIAAGFIKKTKASEFVNTIFNAIYFFHPAGCSVQIVHLHLNYFLKMKVPLRERSPIKR